MGSEFGGFGRWRCFILHRDLCPGVVVMGQVTKMKPSGGEGIIKGRAFGACVQLIEGDVVSRDLQLSVVY